VQLAASSVTGGNSHRAAFPNVEAHSDADAHAKPDSDRAAYGHRYIHTDSISDPDGRSAL
jgi:hypothetical protein